MDWIALFEDNQIPYVTRGKNTKRGEVSVRCPWCGEDDPSEHMGVNLTAERWGCLRNPMHRGYAPPKLIAGLLGVGIAQARAVAAAYSVTDPDSLDAALALLTGTSDSPKPVQGYEVPLHLYDEFKPITSRGTGRKYWDYLAARGFHQVDQLVKDYDLLYTTTGRWKDRIIIPLVQQGELIGWTARAIVNPIEAPRYDSSSERIKQTVFNEDELQAGGDLLVVVEGPFDAIKVDYYGRWFGARATCGFGTSLSMDQIAILWGLRRKFRKVLILFDQGTVDQSFYAADWLQGPNVSVGYLPEGVDDPGELGPDEIMQLIKESG